MSWFPAPLAGLGGAKEAHGGWMVSLIFVFRPWFSPCRLFWNEAREEYVSKIARERLFKSAQFIYFLRGKFVRVNLCVGVVYGEGKKMGFGVKNA